MISYLYTHIAIVIVRTTSPMNYDNKCIGLIANNVAHTTLSTGFMCFSWRVNESFEYCASLLNPPSIPGNYNTGRVTTNGPVTIPDFGHAH